MLKLINYQKKWSPVEAPFYKQNYFFYLVNSDFNCFN